MKTHDRISVDPSVMTGKPCIKGTRVTVSNVVRQLAAGRSIAEICQDYPYLSGEDVSAALAFAADMTNGETYELLAS